VTTFREHGGLGVPAAHAVVLGHVADVESGSGEGATVGTGGDGLDGDFGGGGGGGEDRDHVGNGASKPEVAVAMAAAWRRRVAQLDTAGFPQTSPRGQSEPPKRTSRPTAEEVVAGVIDALRGDKSKRCSSRIRQRKEAAVSRMAMGETIAPEGHAVGKEAVTRSHVMCAGCGSIRTRASLDNHRSRSKKIDPSVPCAGKKSATQLPWENAEFTSLVDAGRYHEARAVAMDGWTRQQSALVAAASVRVTAAAEGGTPAASAAEGQAELAEAGDGEEHGSERPDTGSDVGDAVVGGGKLITSQHFQCLGCGSLFKRDSLNTHRNKARKYSGSGSKADQMRQCARKDTTMVAPFDDDVFARAVRDGRFKEARIRATVVWKAMVAPEAQKRVAQARRRASRGQATVADSDGEEEDSHRVDGKRTRAKRAEGEDRSAGYSETSEEEEEGKDGSTDGEPNRRDSTDSSPVNTPEVVRGTGGGDSESDGGLDVDISPSPGPACSGGGDPGVNAAGEDGDALGIALLDQCVATVRPLQTTNHGATDGHSAELTAVLPSGLGCVGATETPGVGPARGMLVAAMARASPALVTVTRTTAAPSVLTPTALTDALGVPRILPVGVPATQMALLNLARAEEALAGRCPTSPTVAVQPAACPAPSEGGMALTVTALCQHVQTTALIHGELPALAAPTERAVRAANRRRETRAQLPVSMTFWAPLFRYAVSATPCPDCVLLEEQFGQRFTAVVMAYAADFYRRGAGATLAGDQPCNLEEEEISVLFEPVTALAGKGPAHCFSSLAVQVCKANKPSRVSAMVYRAACGMAAEVTSITAVTVGSTGQRQGTRGRGKRAAFTVRPSLSPSAGQGKRSAPPS